MKQKTLEFLESHQRVWPERSRDVALSIVEPFEAVPVLEGEEAQRFVNICNFNSEMLASSEYNKDKEDWVKGIIAKKKR